mmetsp:Transcript_38514/g.91321  ORF Transcript_38514/g.91321 Transcript_38514/m.91321 type:complete len:315 (-) Transcript_38514:665-1609(-)|eukprot:CAMPEP_0177599980 /NCGR_PEP_ID=MMETSP0419_2-20121207/13336_1 /TAXON_ID=582737 /ORGANISM="Tetraselmis sp., Strain GSL018" /LENGTH=314 /DNA_ID=CAMNT_0019092857 /DNA_START=147 /DNA_END=1091 /DNA_ORIENTATION=-
MAASAWGSDAGKGPPKKAPHQGRPWGGAKPTTQAASAASQNLQLVISGCGGKGGWKGKGKGGGGLSVEMRGDPPFPIPPWALPSELALGSSGGRARLGSADALVVRRNLGEVRHALLGPAEICASAALGGAPSAGDGLLLPHRREVEREDRKPLPRRIAEDHVVHRVGVDLAVPVEAELRDAVECPFRLPRHSWEPMHSPPHPDAVVLGLPKPFDFHICRAEENLPVKPQTPKNELVVVYAFESVPGILENDIIPVYLIVQVAQEKERDILAKSTNCVANVCVEILASSTAFVSVGVFRLVFGLFLQPDLKRTV